MYVSRSFPMVSFYGIANYLSQRRDPLKKCAEPMVSGYPAMVSGKYDIFHCTYSNIFKPAPTVPMQPNRQQTRSHANRVYMHQGKLTQQIAELDGFLLDDARRGGLGGCRHSLQDGDC